jgi:hypothetical protein
LTSWYENNQETNEEAVKRRSLQAPSYHSQNSRHIWKVNSQLKCNIHSRMKNLEAPVVEGENGSFKSSSCLRFRLSHYIHRRELGRWRIARWANPNNRSILSVLLFNLPDISSLLRKIVLELIPGQSVLLPTYGMEDSHRVAAASFGPGNLAGGWTRVFKSLGRRRNEEARAGCAIKNW